jgi:hypothetical protein
MNNSFAPHITRAASVEEDSRSSRFGVSRVVSVLVVVVISIIGIIRLGASG